MSQRVETAQAGHTVLDYSPGASLTEIVQSIVDGLYSHSSSIDLPSDTDVQQSFDTVSSLVSTTISAFVKNIVESSGEGYAQFAHTLDIENIQGLILDNGDIAVAWTLLEPIGNHGARQFIYSCVIDPATGELKSDIHDLRDQYQHDFWIDVTFGLERVVPMVTWLNTKVTSIMNPPIQVAT